MPGRRQAATERVAPVEEPQAVTRGKFAKDGGAGNGPSATIGALPLPHPRSDIATPEPARQVENASIEKFDRAAQAAQFDNADKSDKVETVEQAEAQRTERSQKVEQPAKAERKGTLDSLLKKFLPGTDPARKK